MKSDPAITNVVGRMPYASNATLLVELADGRRAIYKPADGERPLWDFPHGSLAAREVLTWEVAEAMHLTVVPHTFLLAGPFGIGSVQIFVDEDLDVDPRPLLEGPADALWPLAVLDTVINNADRKLGHILIERETGALWGIDNGLSFHTEDKLRTILWGFAGRSIPLELMRSLGDLHQALGDGLHQRVTDLLSGPEADALTERTTAMLATGCHPHPPSDRPAVPWPMW